MEVAKSTVIQFLGYWLAFVIPLDVLLTFKPELYTTIYNEFNSENFDFELTDDLLGDALECCLQINGIYDSKEIAKIDTFLGLLE